MRKVLDDKPSYWPKRFSFCIASGIYRRSIDSALGKHQGDGLCNWFFLLGLSLIFTGFLGCDPRPTEKENIRAQRSADQVPNPVNIDANGIQRIVDMRKKDPPEETDLIGKTIQCTGKVVSIETTQTANDSMLEVKIQLSKEPAFTAECYFTDQHRSTIQTLAIGTTLQVKGLCRNVSVNRVELVGCIIPPVMRPSSPTP